MENDYYLGEWVVRPQRDCIERGGESVHLKPKAMAVLKCLADAGGKVVTRNELFDTVWPGGVVSDATLTQCVVELRNAFGDSARRPEFIETIPKVGFRLIPEVKKSAGQAGAAGMHSGSIARGDLVPAARKSKVVFISTALVVLFLAIFWYQAAFRQPASPGDGGDLKSLAVLPFADMSEGQDQGWFADGISDEMIGRLSQLKGLNVADRTSSFQFKGRTGDLADISEELDVEYILEGGVRKDEGRLRITAHLIQPGKGIRLWSEQFDRSFEDVFDVQAEIAESVAVALSITLNVGALGREPGGTSSVEAYEEMLKAAELQWEFTSESLLLAMNHVRRAVEIDPEYAHGWYMLAGLYREAVTFKGIDTHGDWMELSAEALARAVELDPDPEAGYGHLYTLYVLNHQWSSAQELLGPLTGRELVEDDPRIFAYADFLYKVGRVQDAIPLMEHWLRLHPDGPGNYTVLAHMYAAKGRFDEAYELTQQAYDIGGYIDLSTQTGVVLALSANDRAQLSKWLPLRVKRSEEDGIALLKAMSATLDDRLAALATLRSIDSDKLAYEIALWAAWHGDSKLALQAMRRSNSTFSYWLPLMADVRRLPAFKDLVREMGLVDYWRENEWSEFCKPVGEDDFECE